MNDTLRKILGLNKKEEKFGDELGSFDCKPFHNFKYSLIYAQEICAVETEKVEVYSRVYKDTTFVNVLVSDETGFEPLDYRYETIKPKLIEAGVEATQKNIVIIIYQHNNDNTKALCKKFFNSSKTNFEQSLVYNPKSVRIDFYKPIPKFYKLYDKYCENIYFDLACIDHTKR